MQVPSPNTQLGNRVLWYDGDSVFPASTISDCLLQGIRVRYADKITDEVESYNRLIPADQSITTKTACNPLSFDWVLPTEYAQLDMVEYAALKHGDLMATKPYNNIPERVARLAYELDEFEQRGLFDLLRALVYVINTLLHQNVAWGIGRGSSTASYLLFVIGVHDVDSFKYDLAFSDFMRDEE